MKRARRTLELLAKAMMISRRSGVRVFAARASAKVGTALKERARRYRTMWSLRIADARSRVGPLTVRSSSAARLSILVTGTQDRRAFARTLRSLSNAGLAFPFEILADDAQDATASINRRVASASGRYALVLRAGTVVTKSAVHALVGFLECEPHAGAAVPKVVDGASRLLDAGLTIGSDGGLDMRVRQAFAADPSVSFACSVDGSAFMTLLRMSSWHECGGLNPGYDITPALADLCARFRARERDTVYRPDAVVLWTGPREEPDFANLRIEMPVHVRAQMRGTTILVVDELVPREDRDAGSKRLIGLIRIMRSLGHAVVFVPDRSGSQLPASRILREIGCDVRTHEGDASSIVRTIEADVAWLCRPQIGQRYGNLVKVARKIPVIYDTVDLHHLRLAREEALLGRTTGWELERDKELDLIRTADRAVVTSNHEQQLLAALGLPAVVIPVIEEPRDAIVPFARRDGLLFVGNFTHAPNADALEALAQLTPRVRERLPGVYLDVVGFDPDGTARGFAADGLRVRGHAASLRPYYERARLLVAPLRFGAGAKGKIVESMAHGLPVVTTPIGAEGLGDEAERALLVVENGDHMVEAITRTYTDASAWSSLSDAGLHAAKRFSSAAVRPLVAELLASVTSAGATV